MTDKWKELKSKLERDKKVGFNEKLHPHELWLLLRGERIADGYTYNDLGWESIIPKNMSEKEFLLLVNAAIERKVPYTLQDINALRELHKGKEDEEKTYLMGYKLNQIFSARFEPDVFDNYWNDSETRKMELRQKDKKIMENQHLLVTSILDGKTDDELIEILKAKEEETKRYTGRYAEMEAKAEDNEKGVSDGNDDNNAVGDIVVDSLNPEVIKRGGGKKRRRKKRTRKRRKSRRKKRRKSRRKRKRTRRRSRRRR